MNTIFEIKCIFCKIQCIFMYNMYIYVYVQHIYRHGVGYFSCLQKITSTIAPQYFSYKMITLKYIYIMYPQNKCYKSKDIHNCFMSSFFSLSLFITVFRISETYPPFTKKRTKTFKGTIFVLVKEPVRHIDQHGEMYC